MSRLRSSSSLLLAAALITAPARGADPVVQACLTDSESAQRLQLDHKLLAARQRFLACSRAACPKLVRDDCVLAVTAIEAALPSVVISARDKSGHDVPIKRVLLDGAPFLDKLEGKSVSVDPGAHVFRVERPSGVAAEQKAIITEGEKNRSIVVVFADEPEPTTPEPAARPRVSAFIAAGVSVVALSSFAYFGLTGRADANERRSACGPYCPDSDLSAIRTKLIVADVSLGIGLFAGALSAWLFLRPDDDAPPAVARSTVDVAPLPGGGVVRLMGTF